jgi:hypothetical protein
MGFMDKVKEMFGGNADEVAEGADKATDMVDDKTGGEHTDKLDNADDPAVDAVDKLAGEDGSDSADTP